MKKYLLLIPISFLLMYCSDSDNHEQVTYSIQDTTYVDFWNGNRSFTRQEYEREVLNAILEATQDEMGPWEIVETLDEYPGDEESLVFSEKNHDLFVTIAGNQKFGDDDMIVIPHLLTKNLLGYRIPIIREEDAATFDAISNSDDIKKLQHGIPLTWSDAVIFRHNGYQVVEDGDFDDIFERLSNKLFDYSAYGANEVLGVYERRASNHEGLVLDQNILLFYPFPLVFYINPEQTVLADRIEKGMQKIMASGALDAIFNSYYEDIVNQLNLDNRILFTLDNPLIPDEFSDLKPDLENL